MKDGVGECLCLGDDCASGAAEQTKPGNCVLSAIKPAKSSRPGSLSVWHRLGILTASIYPASRYSNEQLPGM